MSMTAAVAYFYRGWSLNGVFRIIYLLLNTSIKLPQGDSL